MRLDGKCALVTGSSRGIGRSVALAFAARGARVIVNSAHDVQGGKEVAEEISRNGGTAHYVCADVGEDAAVARLIRDAEKTFGPVDVLVNNAGKTESVPFGESTPVHFYRMMNSNYVSAVLCSRRVVGGMVERREGVIINTSSIRGEFGHGRPGAMAYSAAKCALNSFTRTLAQEVAPHVRVNAVAPGFVATSYLERISREQREAWLGAIPLGRFIEPDEIAGAYVFLAESRYLTGTILTADAGFTLGRD